MSDEVRASAAFDAKLDPAIVEARYTARLADMITGETAADHALADATTGVDDIIRGVLALADPAPPSTDVIWYLTFGRICWRLDNTYPDNIRDAEEANIEVLWVDRGLDEDVLDDIVTAINAMS
jgi:hypothetical protein